MQETMSKVATWLVVFCAFGLAEAAAQQLQPQDIPPDNPWEATIRTLPIDSSLRASLEGAIKSRDYSTAASLLHKELEENPKNPVLLTFLAGFCSWMGSTWQAPSPLNEPTK